MVNEDIKNELSSSFFSENNLDKEIIDELVVSGFFTDNENYKSAIPNDNNSFIWSGARNLLFVIGFLSVVIVLLLLITQDFPLKYGLKNDSIDLWENILYIVIFAIFTATIHEFMHMVFANNLNKGISSIKLSLKKASATVSMTHIWVWSFKNRIAAISAGVIADVFELAILMIAYCFVEHWMITIAISILGLRIMWQFRFHKNCDGKIIAMMILDNPFIEEDYKRERTNLTAQEIKIWRYLRTIGYIVEFCILFFWILPFLCSIIKEVLVYAQFS